MTRTVYWQGKKPSGGKGWMYTSAGALIEDPRTLEAVLHAYNRYAQQWNEIELDRDRDLRDHTHKLHGAQTVGGNPRKFILHYSRPRGAWSEYGDDWILEVRYARGFRPFHWNSCGLNALRSLKDISSVCLHWAGDEHAGFHCWLAEEAARGVKEYTEYRGKR